MKLRFFIVCVFLFAGSYVYSSDSFCVAPISFTSVKVTSSAEIQNKINSLKAIPLSQIQDFIRLHPEFKDSYYDKMNPAYPNGGCDSYSYLVSEELEQEGIEHLIIQTAAHYYILLRIEFPNGSLKEVVLDYTADQAFVGKTISPLLEPKDNLAFMYPEIYSKYWKPEKIVPRNYLNFSNSYMFLIGISSLIIDIKEQFSVSS